VVEDLGARTPSLETVFPTDWVTQNQARANGGLELPLEVLIREIEEEFRATGLGHLMAVSGDTRATCYSTEGMT
jgi:hypothetical protein